MWPLAEAGLGLPAKLAAGFAIMLVGMDCIRLVPISLSDIIKTAICCITVNQ